MTDLEWRIHSRNAFQVLFELNSDRIPVALDGSRSVREVVWRFLKGARDYTRWHNTPWQDQALALWHERCLLAWFWIRNEAAILDLRLAAPIDRLAERLEKSRPQSPSDGSETTKTGSSGIIPNSISTKKEPAPESLGEGS